MLCLFQSISSEVHPDTEFLPYYADTLNFSTREIWMQMYVYVINVWKDIHT